MTGRKISLAERMLTQATMPQRLTDVVKCIPCNIISVDIGRVHCPRCQSVMGETRMTWAEITGHWAAAQSRS